MKLVKRKPDLIIGDVSEPYLLRWYIIPRNPIFNIYLHNFLRSDDDRALHDHPWFNVSILLQGRYVEHTQRGAFIRWAGDVIVRLSGKMAHRIELTDGPVWTLFLTGPRYREWGFLCPQGWRHWSDFTNAKGNDIGVGCE